MADIIQIRGGTAAQWTTANTLLADREIGVETDTLKIKFGDGVTTWNSLGYASGGASPWQGDWDYPANSNLDPVWSPGQYGHCTVGRGVPSDPDYVPDGAMIFKTTTGFEYK